MKLLKGLPLVREEIADHFKGVDSFCMDAVIVALNWRSEEICTIEGCQALPSPLSI